MGDTANITIGPSQIFIAPAGTTVPNFTGVADDFDAFTSPGFTQDGIEWDWTPTWKDISVDERLGPVKKKLIGQKLVISAKLSETQLSNMNIAIPSSTFNGTDTLTLGTVDDVPEFLLGWIGPAPKGKVRECIVYRVVSMAAVKAHYQRKTELIYNIQFEALSDSTQTNALADLATYKDF